MFGMSSWPEPRFAPNTEHVCDDCGETKGVTDALGRMPKKWEMSWLCSSNGKGGLIYQKVTCTCPYCLAEWERRDQEDEWDYAHENPYR